MMDVKTPVIIVSGYLGAGKTTLLLDIIRYAGESGIRLAIVMNEFGAIPIDGKIIQGKGIEIAELSGGCVCCSLSGEFGEAVKDLRGIAKPEWIVVEMTGAADPSALAYDIANLIEGVRLDSIITIADADSLARFPNLGQTGREQIEVADLIILNKIDLVDAEKRGEIIGRITGINPRANILEAVRCGIDLAMVFSNSASSGDGARGAKRGPDHEIETQWFGFTSGRRMDHEKALAVFASLPREIYRAKGFLWTERGRFLMNYVAGRLDLEEFNNDRTELVFIGEKIAGLEAGVSKALLGCLL